MPAHTQTRPVSVPHARWPARLSAESEPVGSDLATMMPKITHSGIPSIIMPAVPHMPQAATAVGLGHKWPSHRPLHLGGPNPNSLHPHNRDSVPAGAAEHTEPDADSHCRVAGRRDRLRRLIVNLSGPLIIPILFLAGGVKQSSLLHEVMKSPQKAIHVTNKETQERETRGSRLMKQTERAHVPLAYTAAC